MTSDAPRDYLQELDIAMRNDPQSSPQGIELPESSLSELQDDSSRETLLQIVTAALGVPNGGTRKTAAFALAQIGDPHPRVLEALERHLQQEPAAGNREAIAAARTVLHRLPLKSGSTEMERRKAVENAYFERPLDADAASPYSETASSEGGGCLSAIVVGTLAFLYFIGW